MAEYKEYTLQGLPDSEIKIDYNLIFMCMPFNNRLQKLFGAINIKTKFDRLFETICTAINEYNEDNGTQYHCMRSDTVYRAGRIMAIIWNKIREANIIIADLSGLNENVCYELGLSHAIGKYTILISSGKAKKLPFDISHENCIFYKNNEEGLNNLRKRIKEAIDGSRYIIDFNTVTSPTQQGWLSVHGTSVGDILTVRRDRVLQRNVLYTDTDMSKGRFIKKYDLTIDYAIWVSPSRTNVVFRVKAIDSERFGIYFRIRVKENPNLDFWIIYTYKNVETENNDKTSSDGELRHDPNWPNEIECDLENLEKNDWSGWVEFSRNLKDEFTKAKREFIGFFDNYNFHKVIGIRIKGPCYIDFIEFK